MLLGTKKGRYSGRLTLLVKLVLLVKFAASFRAEAGQDDELVGDARAEPQ